ncbi:MAG: hypothetical protein AAFO85_19480, partial [Cyanobacteria bacterium J06598_4]
VLPTCIQLMLGLALSARNRDKEALVALNQALELYQSDGNKTQAEQVSVLIEEIDGESEE